MIDWNFDRLKLCSCHINSYHSNFDLSCIPLYIKQIKNQDDDVWICDVETFEPVSRYNFTLLHTNVKMNSDLYHSVESEKTEDRDKWMINKSSTLLVIADRKIVKEKAESINYALKRGCEVCYLCESS